MEKIYKILQMHRVIYELASETDCVDAQDAALNMKPASSYDEMKELISETNAAYKMANKFGDPFFNGLGNVESSLKRATSGGRLDMMELLNIAENLRIFRSLNEWHKKCSQKEPIISQRILPIVPNKYLEEKIETSILSTEEMADSASPELADIRRKIRSASQNVRERLEKMTKSPSYQKYLQEPIITMRDSRFVIPVKSEHKNDVPGIVHDTSSSGATLFIEPVSVVEANNDIRELRSKECLEIERILYSLSGEVSGFADSIRQSYNAAVKLNLIFAKARLGSRMEAIFPKINNEGRVVLKKARHPQLNPRKVVPMDLSLGVDFNAIVITGPNTGGKTVALMTVGTMILMTMCGLMIPASEESEISFFENILVDIGGEQSIEQSLSTFSAHMTNIVNILKTVNSSSLVLLDELGAGTDPVEGAALATSILEAMKNTGAKVMATTHYAELKSYAIVEDGVENACCEFDVATLMPTYRLLIGVPGASNAFAISERLGVSQSIVSRARELVNEEHTRFEKVVRSLEDKRNDLEKEQKLVEKLKSEAELLKDGYTKKFQLLEEDKTHIIEKSKAEAEKIVSQTRAQAREILDEIAKIKKNGLSSGDKSNLKSKIKKIEETADPVEKKTLDGYVLPRKLKNGDTVLIVDIGQKGTVIENQNEDSSTVLVQAGPVKTRVSLKNLKLLDEAQPKSKPHRQIRTVKSRADSKITRELDLRGKTVLEAMVELDAFIDNAVMAGVNQLTVIHGKGTGVLRQEVQQHLKKHPSVKSYRLGVFGEGENGVTIVELK